MADPTVTTIINEDGEEIRVGADGMEVWSEDEEPTQSDLDFIANEDEPPVTPGVEDLLETVINEEVGPPITMQLPPRRMTRQVSSTYDDIDIDGGDEEDSDYVPEETDDEYDADEEFKA